MKVLGPAVSKILLGLFMVAIFALTVTLTFGSLTRLFPDNNLKAASGLLLFDIAGLVWFLVLIFLSRGGTQRAIAFLMFLLSVLGTGLFSGLDSMMSGQQLVEIPVWAGESIVYTFFGVTFANLFMLYIHHMASPERSIEMRTQAQKDKLIDRAMDKFEERLDQEAEELANVISDRMHSMALADMRLGQPTVIDSSFSEPERTQIITPDPANPTNPPKRGK